MNPLGTRAIPERLRGVFTTSCYTNPRVTLPNFRVAKSCGKTLRALNNERINDRVVF